MASTFPLNERSISEIYLDSKDTVTYTIPIYQRNYAWEEDEIKALIKDVYDACQKKEDVYDASQKKKDVYYIGTLVTYKRGDNIYEVIDGQQRLTTIYIILKALGVKVIKNKLTYSARNASKSTIENLDKYPELGDNIDSGIRNGYKYADMAINEVVVSKSMQDGKTALEAFTKFFCDNVHIIHYEVPKDVDLNHYFEVIDRKSVV